MSHPDLAPHPADPDAVDDLVADDPFTAVNYHFGMLLGVDDFETEFAYHRGRDRLHQGWLHGAGVVWGLAVGLDTDRGEVRVTPGLALDGAGRNLHLDTAACLDPAAWYAEHEDEVALQEAPPEGAELAFDAHVTAGFASCLTRPVPALAEPCAGAGVETAYSRVWETIDLRLVPGPAPEPADRYRRVRILLGLLAAEADRDGDATADAARAAVLDTAPEDRAAAALAALRAMANADAAALGPPEAGEGPRVLTPQDLATTVVLANIRDLALRRVDGRLTFAGGTLDLGPRRSHVATATLQELAAATLAATPASAPQPQPQPAATTVTGATLAGSDLTLTLSGPLDTRSARSAAFSVTALQPGGWVEIGFADPPAYDATVPSLTLTLEQAPAPPWQVIAYGSGPRPLVDADLTPLGGGHDFVHIQRS